MMVWLLIMLAAIVGSAWVFGAWGWLWVRVKRLEEGGAGAAEARLLRELDQLREQVASTDEEARRLAERVDFLERLLEAPERGHPGGPRLMGDPEREDS